jgi:SNF2 family DNA or RNA helicase
VLVIPKAKALALKLKDPARVKAVVPRARSLELRGQHLTAVPHTLPNVMSLRELGIRAPSPILHYYQWPGQFKPYDHQRQTAAFLTTHERCLVLNEIGTGKTQSALWAADYLMEIGAVEKVLILSPLSTLERVWGDAIFKGFYNRKHVVLHGTAERRKRLLRTEADFYIVNHDGFNIIADEATDMFDLVIVDEAAVLRNPSTTRFKYFRKWMDRNSGVRLWLMTGTPTPNEPTDAWTLAKLVDSPNVPRSYTSFREQVMTKIGQWKWMPRPESIEVVKHVLQPAVRYTRDECFDLPDTVTQTRRVELTKDQRKYFDTMLRQLVIELDNSATAISAVNEAVKLQKLVQIACGVAYTDDGQDFEVDCGPRINAVKEVIEEAGEKVILFVPLTGTLKMLERELSKHWTVAVVNGAVSSTKRDKIFYDFQHSRDPRVLIAHPATMAHGLTLTAASTVIWYGPITSNEQYVQANGRVERIGKRHVSNVVHIEATELEHKMYQRLANKQKLQGLLLDLIKEQTER